MKKTIAFITIIVGVVLFTIGNTIQMYSTISILENRLAEKEQTVDTVEVEVDTMSFTEDSIKLVEYVREHDDIDHIPLWYILQNQVRLKSEHMLDGFIPVTWHKNGFPKICVNYWFKKDKNNNDGGLARTGHIYLFLSDSGHVIAQGEGKKYIRWWCEDNGNKGEISISFSNPNRCKNFYATRSNQ